MEKWKIQYNTEINGILQDQKVSTTHGRLPNARENIKIQSLQHEEMKDKQ